jgi:peptide/nickel transport system permease protein
VAHYLFVRITSAVATLFAGAVVSFGVFHLLPGNVAETIAGLGTSQVQIAAIAKNLGLDNGIVVQFVHWLWLLAHGKLGESYVSFVPVTTLLAERLPVTLELIGTSLVVILLTAIPLSLGAVRPGSMLDKLAMVWSIVWLSIPVFWVGLVLVELVAVKWRLLPASGFVSFLSSPLQALRYTVLPSITLGFYLSAIVTQYLRQALLGIMQEDYILAARAKGLSEREVVLRHAVRPALIPFLTVLGVLVGTAVGGTVLIEAVFNLGGFGQMLVSAVIARDYYVVQDSILIIISAVIIMNLLVDVLYAIIDPRIRYADGA